VRRITYKYYVTNAMTGKLKVTKMTKREVYLPNPLDVQVGGGHYKSMKIQPVKFIMANNLGFCEGNAIKYICRHASKNGVEDLKKAIHYIELLIHDRYSGARSSGS
jgi:hypothetical protein